MSNQLQTFINEQFGEIRTVKLNEKDYFVAVDIAKALGYADTTNAIKQHCRWVAKCQVPHPQSSDENKTLEVNVIPEGDVYRMVCGSELPSAEKFEKWVFDEVLPSLRKTGEYKIPQPGIHEMKLICERSKLQHEALEMKPKADYYDDIVDSDGLMTMDVAAKALHIKGIGRTKLFAILRQLKILNKRNIPYQEYINRGLFEVKQKVIEYPGGIAKKVTLVTLVTPKGLQYIKKKLNNK